VTVIANPETTISGGWIGSPTSQSAVTGTVNITTIPGLTLTSGTLTIYPSNFPSSLTTINANTTGTGTIGTLDTTTLTNGTYWLRLQATNSLAQTQTSVIQIHVSGEFKPGRIQTSMTDLVDRCQACRSASSASTTASSATKPVTSASAGGRATTSTSRSTNCSMTR